MYLLHVRLKNELDRLGLKPAAAAKSAGEPDSQGLRDVLGGRKRLSADLLAALSSSGVDVLYVLTGARSSPTPMTTDEHVLLDGYRTLEPATKKRMLAFMLGGADSPPAPVKKKKTVNVTSQTAGRDIKN